MGPGLNQLVQIASKKEKVILGLMSGTSIDGLDLALCRISGSGKKTIFNLDHFTTKEYSPEVKEELIKITSVESVKAEELCIWHTFLAHIHAKMILEVCSEWHINKKDVDLIASHGHTIYHAPIKKHAQWDKPNATLQIGDGNHIAHKTGIITISDFRQKDTAQGGEGAPLAAYGDYLLFSHPKRDRVLINLGGIANFTYLPAKSIIFPPLSMDTGPASTLIDAAMRKLYDAPYDNGGKIARKGTVQREVLNTLKRHPYFFQEYPKTTGPEMFNLSLLDEALKNMGNIGMQPDDIIATLTRLTSETLSEAILKEIKNPNNTECFISGGGTLNTTLIQWISDDLKGLPLKTTDDLGLISGAKEAVIFAVLANEAISGEGDIPALGKISLP